MRRQDVSEREEREREREEREREREEREREREQAEWERERSEKATAEGRQREEEERGGSPLGASPLMGMYRLSILLYAPTVSLRDVRY